MNDKKLAIINGHLIDPANNRSGLFNITIENGTISKIGNQDSSPNFDIIDASGKIVAPGFIDLHVHLREPGQTHKEDIETGTKAAAAGGFTKIFCMPNTSPPIDNIEIVRDIKMRVAEVSSVEVYPVSAMSVGLKGGKLVDYNAMAKEGVIAVSDDGSSIQNAGLMKEAMEIAKSLDLLVISHPEDHLLSAGGVMNEGGLAKKIGLKGIPREAENSIIDRDIELARTTGARLHLAHVSTAEGIELVRRAKKDGLKVTCEVMPHHLLLTEEACRNLDPNTKMNPPLRTETDRQALIKGLQDGTVDAIATDHAPHAYDEKFSIHPPSRHWRAGRDEGKQRGSATPSPCWRAGRDEGKQRGSATPSPLGERVGVRGSTENFNRAPFGVIGMETAFPVCMKLVEEKLITLERLIELFTSGPARVAFGSLSTGKMADVRESKLPLPLGERVGVRGSLSCGTLANLTIIDPNASYKIDSSKFLSKSKNTPFDGWQVKGKIFYTIIAGKIVYKTYSDEKE